MSTTLQHVNADDAFAHSEKRVTHETAISHFMPAMSLQQAIGRHNALVEYVRQGLKENHDFGVIPGTQKPTLLKPGAEKLTTFFGLTKQFTIVERVEDWDGDQHGGEPFFYYLYRCALSHHDLLIAEADGSCNSRESKYRYRQGERKCPQCGKAAIIKGKAEYGGGYVCFRKKDGCGTQFAENDPAITAQQIGRMLNPDIADLVNTIQKMAQKRSLIAATLLAVNASEFFTQDVEDMMIEEGVLVATAPPSPTRSSSQSTVATKHQGAAGVSSVKQQSHSTLSDFHQRIHERRKQLTREGAETESVLNQMLGSYGGERVEELNLEQAQGYGLALKALHEAFVAAQVK